jgi:hypothetical protein
MRRKSPRSRADYLGGLALGASIGVASTLGFCWALSGLDERIADNIVGFGTIVGTLFAAFIALHGVTASLDHQKQIEMDRVEKKLHAAKATLPLVLSALYEICSNRIQAIVKGKAENHSEPFSLDQNGIQIVERCIEHSDGEAREAMKEVLQIYQILVARYQRLETPDPLFLKDGGSGSFHRIRSMIDWVCLQALVESIFDYGRDRSSSVDRSSVHARAMATLSFLSDEDGWLYDNDPFYREECQRFIDGQFRSFSDPIWKQKQSAA